MSKATETIDRVIRAGLAPRLKAEGFKKQARNFYRRSDLRTDVVIIQASRWNEGASGSFTLNLGVYFPEVTEMAGGPRPPEVPKEYHCSVRARIGHLMPAGTDLWWDVSDEINEQNLAKEVVDAWHRFGRAWLESVASYSGARAELVAQKAFFMAAAVSLVMGEPAEAKDLVPRALRHQPLAADRIREWAKAHALAFPSAV